MSDKLGPVTLSDDHNPVFIGREFGAVPKHSPDKAREIDEEVRAILTERYARAKQILIERRDVLDRFAHALLERETLEESDLRLLLEGRELPALPEPSRGTPGVPARDTDPEGPADASAEARSRSRAGSGIGACRPRGRVSSRGPEIGPRGVCSWSGS
jgi:cell division protease FtsH